jgi:hypothetical protein
MKKIILLIFMLFAISSTAYEQGCVIVRNISGFGQYNFTDNAYSSSDWIVNVTNRYFKAYRDYRGTTELHYALKDSVQTIRSFTTDISVSRLFPKGWSLAFSIPISSNSRASKTEHGGINNPEHVTRSFGIGDLRFTAYKWLGTPKTNQKINVQLGLGLKFPTGDYKYQDYFYRKEDSAVLAPVNPSIQLGDGGTGIITELNTFYTFNKVVSVYGNFYYMLNPRDHNGTSNVLGRTPSSQQVRSGNNINSVPDQYTVRFGVNLKYGKLLLSGGFRTEGIPVHDLLGASNGSRRAGHNSSVEPGIVYSFKKISLYTYVPVIISRKVRQSVADKKESEISNKLIFRQGATGNYLVFIGAQFKL